MLGVSFGVRVAVAVTVDALVGAGLTGGPLPNVFEARKSTIRASIRSAKSHPPSE